MHRTHALCRNSLPEVGLKMWNKPLKSVVLVTPVTSAILRSPVGSRSSCLLKIYKWLAFVMKANWRGSICLKYFLLSKVLGEMCVMVGQPFLYSFTHMWLCSNCVYMQRCLLEEVSHLCSSREATKFLPAGFPHCKHVPDLSFRSQDPTKTSCQLHECFTCLARRATEWG